MVSPAPGSTVIPKPSTRVVVQAGGFRFTAGKHIPVAVSPAQNCNWIVRAHGCPPRPSL